MEAEQIRYLVRGKKEMGGVCCIGSYEVVCRALEISDRWEKILRGNHRWLNMLFRFFVLRGAAREKGTVVLSGELQKILPEEIRYENMKNDFPQGLCEAFALTEFAKIMRRSREAGRCVKLLALLPSDRISPDFSGQLLEAAGEVESLYLWTDDEDEKEWIEDRLEALMEESGAAGMCYNLKKSPYENPFGREKAGRKTENCVVLIDFSDAPLGRLWGIDSYIDGGGGKTAKEIKILQGRRTCVKALRNYLDRAFCATLY